MRRAERGSLSSGSRADIAAPHVLTVPLCHCATVPHVPLCHIVLTASGTSDTSDQLGAKYGTRVKRGENYKSRPE